MKNPEESNLKFPLWRLLDSQLKALCNYLMVKYGIDPKHHMIAANDGKCTALAAGYYLATGKIPVVYM